MDSDTQSLTCLKSVREKKALELKLHPSLLSTNAMLEAVILAKPKDTEALQKLGLLLPWQIDVVGEEFVRVFGIIEPHGQH